MRRTTTAAGVAAALAALSVLWVCMAWSGSQPVLVDMQPVSKREIRATGVDGRRQGLGAWSSRLMRRLPMSQLEAEHRELETRLAAVRERLENKRLKQQVAGLQQAMHKLEARAQARRRDADSGARSSNMMRSKQQVLAGKYPPLVYREKLKAPWFHAVTPQKWEVSAVVHQ